jgi:hypothetical protein
LTLPPPPPRAASSRGGRPVQRQRRRLSEIASGSFSPPCFVSCCRIVLLDAVHIANRLKHSRSTEPLSSLSSPSSPPQRRRPGPGLDPLPHHPRSPTICTQPPHSRETTLSSTAHRLLCAFFIRLSSRLDCDSLVANKSLIAPIYLQPFSRTPSR